MNLRKKTLEVLRCQATVLTVLVLLSIMSWPSGSEAQGSSPVTNHGGKWRIGYYEGGAYTNYPPNVRALVAALGEMGWMEKLDIPKTAVLAADLGAGPDQARPNPDDAVVVWKWVARRTQSRYLEFVEEACWSADWDEQRRQRNRAEAIKRLQAGELDLIMAMGTWAGLDLANNEHSVPTLVMSTSDPVQSKIIKSAEDSGFDHVHARCDPSRYVRQLRLFHSIVNFKRLGVVFEDTQEGRSYASIQDIEKVARERDFEIVYCQAPFSGVDQETAMGKVMECWEELAPQIDALYVTVHRGVVMERLPEMLAPLVRHKIPTFSQRGIEEVKHGVLYGVDRESFHFMGRYYAQTMARIFNGTKPRRLDQVYAGPNKIVVNLEAAGKIGYKVPKNILKVADIIYWNPKEQP